MNQLIAEFDSKYSQMDTRLQQKRNENKKLAVAFEKMRKMQYETELIVIQQKSQI
jgi:hypothetical protein